MIIQLVNKDKMLRVWLSRVVITFHCLHIAYCPVHWHLCCRLLYTQTDHCDTSQIHSNWSRCYQSNTLKLITVIPNTLKLITVIPVKYTENGHGDTSQILHTSVQASSTQRSMDTFSSVMVKIRETIDRIEFVVLMKREQWLVCKLAYTAINCSFSWHTQPSTVHFPGKHSCQKLLLYFLHGERKCAWYHNILLRTMNMSVHILMWTLKSGLLLWNNLKQ